MASRAPAILASTRVAHESQNARSASVGGSSQSFVRGSPPSALLLKSSGASTPDYAHSAPAASPRFANFCVRVCPSNQPYRGASAVAVDAYYDLNNGNGDARRHRIALPSVAAEACAVALRPTDRFAKPSILFTHSWPRLSRSTLARRAGRSISDRARQRTPSRGSHAEARHSSQNGLLELIHGQRAPQ